MAVRPRNWLERKARERAQRQWAEMAESVEFMSQGRIRGLTDEALTLRASLNRFMMRGDRKAGVSRTALDALHLPGGTDWRWRPGFMAGQITRAASRPRTGNAAGRPCGGLARLRPTGADLSTGAQPACNRSVALWHAA